MSRLNVFDLYNDSLDEISADQRGQVNIDRWNRFANKAVRDFIDYLTGRLHEEPTPKLGLLKTQKIADLCAPIIARQMIPYKDGLVPTPVDHDFTVDLRITGAKNWTPGDCSDLPKFTINQILNGQQGFSQVDILSHDEIPSRVNTNIPLLKERACAEQYSDGFLLHNTNVTGSAFMVYLREFDPVVINMAIDTNLNIPVYAPNGSVHPPFDKKVGPYLARKIAQYYFHAVREPGAIQSSDAVSKTE